MIDFKGKYFDPFKKKWTEIQVKLDKKLNFDYSHCTWFAIDGEFTGLYPQRDKDVLWTIASEDINGALRVEMLYTFDKDADLEVLKSLLKSDKEKLFWMGFVDIAYLYQILGEKVSQPVFDVKLASRVTRTYTTDHNVDLLVKAFAETDEDIFPKKEMGKSKEFGLHPSKWSLELHQYNINDVIYLKFLKDNILEMAKNMQRDEIVDAVNQSLPERGLIYANGFYRDIFQAYYNDTDMQSAPIIPRPGRP